MGWAPEPFLMGRGSDSGRPQSQEKMGRGVWNIYKTSVRNNIPWEGQGPGVPDSLSSGLLESQTHL